MGIWKTSQGQGEDIVVIHGWGMNANVWQSLMPLLTDSYRVTAIDLPGFGDSNALTLADSLTDVCAQIDSELPARFHLLGWSLGGLIATQLALSAPQRVTSLTTVGSSPCFIEQTAWLGIKQKLISQFYQQLDDDFAKTIERFMAVQAMGSPHAKALIKQVREWVFAKPLANKQSLLNGLKLLEGSDLRARLVDVKAPFMRFYGRLDSLVPAAAIPSINALAPQSMHKIFPHCAHTPFISAGTEFAHDYRQFLATTD